MNNQLEFLQQMNLKANMDEIQQQLRTLKVEGQAGADLVRIVFNGAMEVVSVKVDPMIINPEDTETLEELIASAITDGQKKIKETIQKQFNPLANMFRS